MNGLIELDWLCGSMALACGPESSQMLLEFSSLDLKPLMSTPDQDVGAQNEPFSCVDALWPSTWTLEYLE